jgi:hypothetical protein
LLGTIVILAANLKVPVNKLAHASKGVPWERVSRTTMNQPKITKLPRNGPKPGQSVSAWLYGKNKSEQAELERLRWEQGKHNKKAP